jgi:signal peptidase II
LIAALVLLLDRATKWLVAQKIALYDSIPVIPGFFRLTHVQNRGAAFGIFDESPSEWKVWMLIVFSLAALVIVTILLWKNSFALTATGVALSLVLGGAAGNLWDRMFEGRVTDFLLFYVGQHIWPAFNIADSAIVCGALLLVAEILFTKNPEQKAA